VKFIGFGIWLKIRTIRYLIYGFFALVISRSMMKLNIVENITSLICLIPIKDYEIMITFKGSQG